jgi:uncharacterized repeat protein (TIGR01451 family)
MFNSTPKSRRHSVRRSISMAILCSPLFLAASAQALPLPKDWCGRLWGIQSSTTNITWINVRTDPNYTLGQTLNAFTSPPPRLAGVPVIPGSGGNHAALGLHAESGTLYALDRSNSILYQYRMNTATTGAWAGTQTTIPIISGANGSVAQGAVNFNKMTVAKNQLIIASSDSMNVYTYTIAPTTGVISGGTLSNPTFDGQTILPDGTLGNPPGSDSNNIIGGGDIAQDEYGDTYMITYDNGPNNAVVNGVPVKQYIYFYKLDTVNNKWLYKDRAEKAGTNSNEQFGGFAIYADTLYVEGAGGSLYKLAVTRAAGATDYDWANNAGSVSLVAATGVGEADLASCGVPAIDVIKTQKIYTDLVGITPGTLAADQTRIATSQYIQYTIVATNQGDAWAKGSTLADPLPAGVTYVPNTATVNGTNLNAVAYPFTTTAATSAATSPTSGEIRLATIAGNTNIATYTFIVKVDGTVPSVSNKATVKYTTPSASADPVCSTGLNCGVSDTVTQYPSIFGTVWKDTNGSAAGTFSNIFTTGEVGTNTNPLVTDPTKPLYALLLDSTGKVLLSQPVAYDGTYAFQALNTSQNNLKIQLSTTTFAAGATPSAVSIPTGWKATSPKITPAFNLALADITNEDFGISLPAGVILVKRITAINGLTTNDGKNLTAVVDPTTTTTTSDDATHKWPAGYLKGAVNAGIVKPGDTIEYTIYYLNDGSADSKKLKICDPIRGNQKYVPGTMKILPGGTVDLPANHLLLTDGVDTSVDRANIYGAAVPTGSPAVTAPTDCNLSNLDSSLLSATDNGGVAIQFTGTGASPQPDLLAIPGATANGTPTGSYGWFRFTTKVNP